VVGGNGASDGRRKVLLQQRRPGRDQSDMWRLYRFLRSFSSVGNCLDLDERGK
jgi:hypothetical protein